MTSQCFQSSTISVVIWFLAISSFTRSRYLSFGLPRFRFPSTVICNIFISLLHTSKSSRPLLSEEFCHRVHVCVPFSRCLQFSHDLALCFLLPTVACAFQFCVQFRLLPLSNLFVRVTSCHVTLFQVTSRFLALVKKTQGRIVINGSIHGRFANPFTGAFSISKFALEAYADVLR